MAPNKLFRNLSNLVVSKYKFSLLLFRLLSIILTINNLVFLIDLLSRLVIFLLPPFPYVLKEHYSLSIQPELNVALRPDALYEEEYYNPSIDDEGGVQKSLAPSINSSQYSTYRSTHKSQIQDSSSKGHGYQMMVRRRESDPFGEHLTIESQHRVSEALLRLRSEILGVYSSVPTTHYLTHGDMQHEAHRQPSQYDQRLRPMGRDRSWNERVIQQDRVLQNQPLSYERQSFRQGEPRRRGDPAAVTVTSVGGNSVSAGLPPDETAGRQPSGSTAAPSIPLRQGREYVEEQQPEYPIITISEAATRDQQAYLRRQTPWVSADQQGQYFYSQEEYVEESGDHLQRNPSHHSGSTFRTADYFPSAPSSFHSSGSGMNRIASRPLQSKEVGYADAVGISGADHEEYIDHVAGPESTVRTDGLTTVSTHDEDGIAIAPSNRRPPLGPPRSGEVPFGTAVSRDAYASNIAASSSSDEQRRLSSLAGSYPSVNTTITQSNSQRSASTSRATSSFQSTSEARQRFQGLAQDSLESANENTNVQQPANGIVTDPQMGEMRTANNHFNRTASGTSIPISSTATQDYAALGSRSIEGPSFAPNAVIASNILPQPWPQRKNSGGAQHLPPPPPPPRAPISETEHPVPPGDALNAVFDSTTTGSSSETFAPPPLPPPPSAPPQHIGSRPSSFLLGDGTEAPPSPLRPVGSGRSLSQPPQFQEPNTSSGVRQ